MLRFVLAACLLVPSILGQGCQQSNVTVTCENLKWDDIPNYLSSLSEGIDRLTLRNVSGNNTWSTTHLSAVNMVKIEGSQLAFNPLKALMKLPNLGTLEISESHFNCWDAEDDFLSETIIHRLYIRESDFCNGVPKISSMYLQELVLTANNLENFPYIEGSNIFHLNIAENFISDIGNLSLMPELYDLDLSLNVLTDIPEDTFLYNKNLNHLNLTGNVLGHISFKAPQLEVLILNENSIHEILEPLYFPNLATLHLSANILSSLTDAFSQLTNLKQLDLSDNALVEIKPATLKGLYSLEVLKLRRNHLKKLPHLSDTLFHLHYLDIAENQLLELDESLFVHLPNLATLYADENELNSIDNVAFALSNINMLSLSRNILTITEKTFKHMSNLHTLDLSETSFNATLDVFADNSDLGDLDLQYNEISQLCGKRPVPEGLNRLILSYNRIKDITCLEAKLMELNISNNPIECTQETKTALRNILDTDGNYDDDEAEMLPGEDETWKAAYESVCSKDALENYTPYHPSPPTRTLRPTASIPYGKDIIYPDSKLDYPDLETYLEQAQMNDFIRGRNEVVHNNAIVFSNEDEDEDEDDDDDDDDMDDLADFFDFRNNAKTRSAFIWASLGFTLFGLVLLCIVAVIGIYAFLNSRKKKRLHSQHASSYTKINGRGVYNDTTSRVNSNNLSSNITRVLGATSITGALKTDSFNGVLGKLGFKVKEEDEMETKMIPSESNSSLA